MRLKQYFNPDLHPDNTLKNFNEFIPTYQLRYKAQDPDPPKVSIERWELTNQDQKLYMNHLEHNGFRKI